MADKPTSLKGLFPDTYHIPRTPEEVVKDFHETFDAPLDEEVTLIDGDSRFWEAFSARYIPGPHDWKPLDNLTIL